MDKKTLSKIINVNLKTIYNWEKNRPELYKYLMDCGKNKSEIEELFEQLDDIEKEMYLSEIRAKILRKKLDNKG